MASHFARAYELVGSVERDLNRGRGTKKDERADMQRRLNGALAALKSAALFGEQPTLREVAEMGPSPRELGRL